MAKRFCGNEFASAQGCHAMFFICAHCDRGQRYCSTACREQARRQQRRRANRRHQQSPEGRLDHRDRQRDTVPPAQAIAVTDQGSLSITSPASFECGPADPLEHPPAPQSGSKPSRLCGCAAGSAAAPDASSIRFHVFHDEGEPRMISPETRAQIRRYFYAEHWKIGTIASELDVHPDAVRRAIESERFNSTQPLRASIVDPYLGFIRQTLDQHPRLRATRIYQMIRDRGYSGSVVQLRRAVARLRPQTREAVPATANVSRRASTSRLGALWSCDGRPRQAQPCPAS